MKKKFIIILLVISVLGVIVFYIKDKQIIFEGSRVKNEDCYTLEFEEMNQSDSHTLGLYKGDVISVEFDIDKGKVNLSIGMDGAKPIYRGNNIDFGKFKVIASEDGCYKISVDAKHASGFINIYSNKM